MTELKIKTTTKSNLKSKSKIKNITQFQEKTRNASSPLGKPIIKEVVNSLLIEESEDSLSIDDSIKLYYKGDLNPVNSCWQREK